MHILDFILNTQSSSSLDILINLLFAGVYSWFISLVYIKFGKSVSNREQFSTSFLLITLCTVLIISLIKSSVALSLGLVGALSIVRFRTAIKEPEELTYLFLCIAVGLGFGANERLITISSATLIIVILIIRGFIKKTEVSKNFNMSIRTSKLSLEKTIEIIKSYSDDISFMRLESDERQNDFLLSVKINNYKKLEACINELKKEDESINVSFLAN